MHGGILFGPGPTCIVTAVTECLQIIYTSNLKNSGHSFALGFEEDQIFVQKVIRNC